MYSYTVCYVVVDNEQLDFYNELLISLSSLRKQRFSGPVIILMDGMTAIEIKRQERYDYKDLLAELKVVETPASYSQTEKSRFIKTSMREHIAGSFLYLDTDTVVAEPLPMHFDEELGAVLDYNAQLKSRTDYDIRLLTELNERCGYTLDMDWPYFNSGCIWSKDSTISHEFFCRWNDEWKRSRENGFTVDQPALNYINRLMGGVVQEMNGIYNVQILGVPTPVNLLNEGIIIHYFNWKSNKYMLQKTEIKAKGYRSEEVQKIVASPKSAFLPCALVSLKEKQLLEDLLFLNGTSILSAVIRLHKKSPKLFRRLNTLFKYLGKLLPNRIKR